MGKQPPENNKFDKTQQQGEKNPTKDPQNWMWVNRLSGPQNGNKAGFKMACFLTTEATRKEIKSKRQLKQKKKIHPSQMFTSDKGRCATTLTL